VGVVGGEQLGAPPGEVRELGSKSMCKVTAEFYVLPL
jgi:hypothetical protein